MQATFLPKISSMYINRQIKKYNVERDKLFLQHKFYIMDYRIVIKRNSGGMDGGRKKFYAKVLITGADTVDEIIIKKVNETQLNRVLIF